MCYFDGRTRKTYDNCIYSSGKRKIYPRLSQNYPAYRKNYPWDNFNYHGDNFSSLIYEKHINIILTL